MARSNSLYTEIDRKHLKPSLTFGSIFLSNSTSHAVGGHFQKDSAAVTLIWQKDSAAVTLIWKIDSAAVALTCQIPYMTLQSAYLAI